MIFEDRLIQKGESGGREAAGQLWGAVRDYVHQKMPSISSDYKIVTRVYANLKGLGDACVKSGIVNSPSLLEEFARGFTGSKQLFDFVDVGSGKDRADDKICGKYCSVFLNSRQDERTESLQKCSNFIFTTAIVVILFSAGLTIMVMLDCLKM